MKNKLIMLFLLALFGLSSLPALNVQAKTTSDNIISDSIKSISGWIYENGSWYYYNSNNKKAVGWIKSNNTWYYLKDDGKMATGWIYNNNWYYMDSDGSMVTGWKQLRDEWYYLQDDGSMTTGISKINGVTYMFSDNGDMETRWVQINNNWYYFDQNGSMATGWLDDNGTWYYLDLTTGKMLIDTQIDGYKIGADGKREVTENQNVSTNSNISDNILKQYRGIDISNNNGYINFISVKSSGVQLVYIKATEGTTYIDPFLKSNYNNALAAGLKIGFYHYLVGTSSPETQADNFYNSIKDKNSDLKPMLDIESTGFDVMNYTLRFIAEFRKLSNMNIGIYTYSNFINNLDARLSNYPLWEANYNNTPFTNLPINNIWFSRIGHQYSDKGFVRGINGNVDLDEFTQGIFK